MTQDGRPAQDVESMILKRLLIDTALVSQLAGFAKIAALDTETIVELTNLREMLTQS